MTSEDLRRLWKLHLLDAAIFDLKAQAAGLDPGRAINARLKAQSDERDHLAAEYHRLHGEQTDLELRIKGLQDKFAKLDRTLYGGTVVNPKEVETYKAEMESIKAQEAEATNRVLELMDQTPTAKAAMEAAEARVKSLRSELAEHQKQIKETHAELEREFHARRAQRAAVAAEIPANALNPYETIRKKHGGIAMAEAVGATCGACGMNLPTKTVEMVKERRYVSCQACGRILYLPEGATA
ncbi:MAG: zinc ribbon domain-containing protein [Fimbriimonadaceae bacterium]